jgi:hypothetical protein
MAVAHADEFEDRAARLGKVPFDRIVIDLSISQIANPYHRSVCLRCSSPCRRP